MSDKESAFAGCIIIGGSIAALLGTGALLFSIIQPRNFGMVIVFLLIWGLLARPVQGLAATLLMLLFIGNK